MTSPFDRALESRELSFAAEEFALRHGLPGTSEYRSAWVRFVQQAHTRNAPASADRTPPDDVTRDDPVGEVLDAAIARAMRIDEATKATAQLVQPGSHALRLVAHHGFSAEFVDFFKTVNDTTTACGSALESGTPVLISDITTSPVFAGTVGLQVMLRAGSRAVASLPVRAPHDRVIAMISTHHPATTKWTDNGILALRHLCESTGLLLGHLMEKPAAQRSGNQA